MSLRMRLALQLAHLPSYACHKQCFFSKGAVIPAHPNTATSIKVIGLESRSVVLMTKMAMLSGTIIDIKGRQTEGDLQAEEWGVGSARFELANFCVSSRRHNH
jgi:hypothetical protein